MKRKLLPLTMMLSAGLVTAVITFIRGDSIIYKLASLLIVFLVFYVIGSVIVMFLDHFDKVNNKEDMIEDEVIEKDADGEMIGQVDQSSEGEEGS